MAAHNMITSFPRATKSTRVSTQGKSHSNIIFEAKSDDLCYIPFVRSESPGSAHFQREKFTQGHAYQEEIIESHFRSYLSQIVTCNQWF